jgi:hypothetical protein
VTVDQFEALVQAQKPADKPWQPVTDYSYEARKVAEGIHPQLIKDVFQPVKVLDVGCGPGHLMTMLERLGIECQGMDVQADPGWWVGSRIIRWDITGEGFGPEDDYQQSWAADLVICREVLEHLTILQIRQAVTNLCKLSSRYVYVTTRFTSRWTSPHPLLDVDTADDLDPTHITMLNKEFLRVLFVLEGFKRRADLEARMDWQHKGRCLVYER